MPVFEINGATLTPLDSYMKEGDVGDGSAWRTVFSFDECSRTRTALLKVAHELCIKQDYQTAPCWQEAHVSIVPAHGINMGKEFKRRLRLLSEAGFRREARALEELTRQSFADAQAMEPPDILGHTPSQRLRVTASRRFGGAAMGKNLGRGKRSGAVPLDAKRFITVPIAVFHDLRTAPKWGDESIAGIMSAFSQNLTIALYEAGAAAWYLSGYDEVAEHDPNFKFDAIAYNEHHERYLKDKERVNKTIVAMQERDWTAPDIKKFGKKKQFVIHTHLWLAAHDGARWMKDGRIERALRRHFDLPHQVRVSRRKKIKSEEGAVFAIGYADKPPGEQSDALIVQDVCFRKRRRAAACWQEGVFTFEDRWPLSKPKAIRALRIRRDHEIAKWPIGYRSRSLTILPKPDGVLKPWPTRVEQWRRAASVPVPEQDVLPVYVFIAGSETSDATMRRLARLGRQSQAPPTCPVARRRRSRGVIDSSTPQALRLT